MRLWKPQKMDTGIGSSGRSGWASLLTKVKKFAKRGISMKRFVLLLSTVFFALSVTAWCQQQETATIVGTVSDSSGAVIPNAKVTVLNPDKGITQQLTSNASGAYSAASLPIGSYTVTAEAAGFQKLVRSGI